MLGIKDFWVFFAYFGSIAGALVCVAYGIINWNKPLRDEEEKEIDEEIEWKKHDPELGQ